MFCILITLWVWLIGHKSTFIEKESKKKIETEG